MASFKTETMKALVADTLATIANFHCNRPFGAGISTGLYDLDQMLGGLQPGELYVVAGRPGMGKTNLVLGIAVHTAVRQQKSTAFFLSTSTATAATQRMLAHIGSIPLEAICGGRLDSIQWESIQKAANALGCASMSITTSGGLDIRRIVQSAQQAAKDYSGLGLLVVDGVQRFKEMRVSPAVVNKRTFEPRGRRSADLESILQTLKELAQELNCPVLLTWQLGPEIDHRGYKQPIVGDLRLTERMEDQIDALVLLHREDVYRIDDGWNGLADLRIVRNRNGPTGSVRLIYEGHYSRFKSLALSKTEAPHTGNTTQNSVPL